MGAVRHNARLLCSVASPASLCAVVKADGYGHGALSVARAALEGGAACLAVATVEEGLALREGGVAAPVLLLSEPPEGAMGEVVSSGITPTLYSPAGVRSAQQAAAAAGRRAPVQVKVDTGMHRVGADPSELEQVLEAVASAPNLEYSALWTHLAVADGDSEEDRRFTEKQLRLFAELRLRAAAFGAPPPMAHAANSAATFCFPESRLDLVRCGIALYGLAPSRATEKAVAALARTAGPAGEGLLPAMSLRAQVSHVRRLEAGERPSYGRLYELAAPSVVATVPLGYADGVPRRYFTEGGSVLVGGHRRPLAGSVTMDQIVVDCDGEAEVAVGDEVVLIGEQGGERLTAWDWADVLGTIGYEVLTSIGARVPRVVVDSGRDRGSR